jgi:hypothetical protein
MRKLSAFGIGIVLGLLIVATITVVTDRGPAHTDGHLTGP